MSPQEEVERIREKLWQISKGYHTILATCLIYRPMALNEDLLKRIKAENKVRTFSDLRFILYRSIIVELFAYGGDPDTRSASIASVKKNLENHEVRAIFRNDYARAYSDGTRDEANLCEEFDNKLDRFLHDANEFVKRLKPFRCVRNKRLAHVDILHDKGRFTLHDSKSSGIKHGMEKQRLDEFASLVDQFEIFTVDLFREQHSSADVDRFWEIGRE